MSILEYAGVSDQGRVRFQNEDFILHEIPDDPDVLRRKGALFVIADGVGGSDAGEIASREAARMLVHAYYESRRAPAPRPQRGCAPRQCPRLQPESTARQIPHGDHAHGAGARRRHGPHHRCR